jgi:heme-degrading monooxygenase HmoA
MLIRIVRMTFQEDKTGEFMEIFKASKHLIRHFEGCTHLELLQDVHKSNIYYTYSYWQSEDNLNVYRNSELFEKVWSATKALFADKPVAYSLNRLMEVD